MWPVSSYFERQVQRQLERTDPLGRLPWQVTLTFALLILALGLLQIVLGRGLSRILGLVLVVYIGPLNVVTALAAREARRRG